MARKIFRFEGTNQTDATLGSTSLTLLNRAGGIIKHDIAAKVNGITGLRFTSSGTGSYTIGRGTSSTSNNVHAFRGSFRISTQPASDLGFGYVRNSANDTHVARFIVTPSGSLMIYHAGNQPITVESVATIAWNTWYDLSLVMVGGSTTAGQITAKLYATASGLQVGSTRSTSTANMTSNPINGFELGVVSSNSNITVLWDDVQIDDGQTNELGRLVPSTHIYIGSSWVTHTPHIWNGTVWVPHEPVILFTDEGAAFGEGPFGGGTFGGYGGFGESGFGSGPFGGETLEFGGDEFGGGGFGL